MSESNPRTVNDLDPEREVFMASHYWNIGKPRAHLHRDCYNLDDDLRIKTAGTLYDDVKICQACRGEHHGGLGKGEYAKATREKLIEMGP